MRVDELPSEMLALPASVTVPARLRRASTSTSATRKAEPAPRLMAPFWLTTKSVTWVPVVLSTWNSATAADARVSVPARLTVCPSTPLTI